MARNYNYKPSGSHNRLEREGACEVGQKYTVVSLMPCCRIYITVMSQVCLMKCRGFRLTLHNGITILDPIYNSLPCLKIYVDPVFRTYFRLHNRTQSQVNARGAVEKVY